MSRVGVTCYEPCCPTIRKGDLAIKLQKDNGVNRKLKPFLNKNDHLQINVIAAER